MHINDIITDIEKNMQKGLVKMEFMSGICAL